MYTESIQENLKLQLITGLGEKNQANLHSEIIFIEMQKNAFVQVTEIIKGQLWITAGDYFERTVNKTSNNNNKKWFSRIV